MRGYYCIYEGKWDRWLYADGHLHEHIIDMYSNVISLNHGSLSTIPVIYQHDHVMDTNLIMRFDTIQEAETYLMTSPDLSTSNGEFYSIRRIYF
jgi:hypothetical protein